MNRTGIAAHPEVTGALDLLAAWIEAQMAYAEIPGLSMGLVCDQELVWARGFGLSDVEAERPATPQTIYRIASISKLFTSVAIMQLRDAGRLGLDDRVDDHLPWFRTRNTFADARPVTIRQLLTHTAGLPREAAFPYWTDFSFPEREQIVRTLPEQEAPYPPETRFKYSNLGLTLAGEIVQAVSGEPYAEYVHRRILAPLGMDSTSVFLPDEHRARLATGYGRHIPGQPRPVHPFTDARGLAPAANLSSTVEDLARFVSLQFRREDRVLTGSTLREMHRLHWLFPDWSGGRGLGFVVYRREGRTLVGHGGHVAGYRSQVLFSPQEQVGVVALFNASGIDPLRYAGRALDWLLPALSRAAAPASPPQADPAWARYAGKYRNAWNDVQVLVRGGELLLINPTEENPAGAPYCLLPAGAHTFRMEGEDGSGPVGELAVFEMDGQDRVTRLKIGENYAFPLAEY